MEIDVQKLKLRLSEIQESTSQIQEYTSLPEKEFWKDKRNILSVEQLLLRAIEAVGSICVHVAAKKLHKGVESPAECFEILEQGKVINASLAASLRKMARFRNLLIHRYWEVEERKVYEYAKKDLGDFDRFIRKIAEYLGF